VADGFLGRWSRRKLDARDGRPLAPEPEATPAPAVEPAPVDTPRADVGDPLPQPLPAVAQEPPQPAPEPPPTLDDVQQLTHESDFRRFTAPDVAPEVKNAALKKLWADPRFNVQDGLDVYIDDYSKPDPMPESMLRQLASAQFLGFFREEERKDEPATGARDDAEGQGGETVAQSGPPEPDKAASVPPPAVPPDHADPDLRLQQDDAAPGGEPGRGAG
jgi:hypothetical protein